ncbi:polymerase III polypeptide A [Capsaspora owczarzaki ATCC 30864]|uniref:DNA-directed RNA polymerase subunit n=1 Tax=Capsaspora owczarzaki (strain ATCC 30864) TaxID=595528 RepID=A0A0D2VTB7_CAPO3|nr:polymerase III polypeptide A [Capsaspora owczarzaki ATCC 30864]
MKETFHDAETSQRISHIHFGLLSDGDMQRISHMRVVNRELYQQPDRVPTPHGPLDKRLGTSMKQHTCETCGHPMTSCPGHFGDLQFELPVFHYGYFKAITTVLQNICKTCSRVMLPVEERLFFLQRLRNPLLEMLHKRAICKKVNEKCRRLHNCPYCNAPNGPVKKVAFMKLSHDTYRMSEKQRSDDRVDFLNSFQEAVARNKDLRPLLTKAMDELNPLRVLRLFEAIPNEDVELLGLDPLKGRPERLILTRMLVPPACIRPSVAMDAGAGSNEDDLTMKLSEIAFINSVIRKSLSNPTNMIANLVEEWEHLQNVCAMYINGDVANQLPQQNLKPVRGFCQRLKGKTGRFRGNLSGKRVDFSSRTVISPDPNLRIDEVAVPEHVAKILTFPERVTSHNIEEMRQLIIAGTDQYPGANYGAAAPLVNPKRYLKYGNRQEIARDLRVGDVVERHLRTGDIALFNRQPSLHKLSIMCHFVRISPFRTFRFNECVCTPYNADFDGDEMNLHVPQTEEARAEAMVLMGVKSNMITPRNGEPLIAAIQDFITGAYLLSRKDLFLDQSMFTQLCACMSDAGIQIDIPPPAILKPVRLWTGKQLFSVLMRPNKQCKARMNLRTASRTYSKKDEEMCKNDGFVNIRNSELLSGSMDKALLGSGSKSTIFYVLLRDFGEQTAADAMSRLAKLASRFLCNYGFSIGIGDVTPTLKLLQAKEVMLQVGYTKCDGYIEAFRGNALPSQPGCSPEQTLESVINGELSQIREDAGKMCLEELDKSNAPLRMALCGSKGSNINISQMIACVGQQTVSGTRIPNGFEDRALPHFPKKSRFPAAKGFVRNSFFTGLSPTEFFFHTMGGREGLVDTAVKTAETGYMQRRLMKALEDLSVQYDSTVRDSIGGVVQLRYGDDELDPASMEGSNKPVDFKRVFEHVRNNSPAGSDQSLFPYEITQFSHKVILLYLEERRALQRPGTRAMHDEPVPQFYEELRGFLQSVADSLASMRDKRGLDPYSIGPLDKSDPRSVALSESARLQQSIVDKVAKYTSKQLEGFRELCVSKYKRATIEAGTAVGAVGAQSIGEPGTQMTLKTFHFAGVASMNITLGVPRIKEIINASKVISTPIITAELLDQSKESIARIVKGRTESTRLGEISDFMREIFTPHQSFLHVRLSRSQIRQLCLQIDAEQVKNALLASKLRVEKDSSLSELKKLSSSFFSIQHLNHAIGNVIVSGISTVKRAVINQKTPGKYNLLVEGTNLLAVMGIEGVDWMRTKSNHIMEMKDSLGIEAARSTIMNEIQYTMQSHGMSIDTRHLMLLADLMTSKGDVLGITRFGIAKMKESVLMLASFEKTTDHLFDASLYGQTDSVRGVSECIIMGIPMTIGTGLFKLLQRQAVGSNAVKKKLAQRSFLFDNPKLHTTSS